MPFGPNGVALNSSYKDRDSVHYMTDLGNAVANFARLVPDGLLVFFPSYAVLTKCTEHWKQDISNGAVIVGANPPTTSFSAGEAETMEHWRAHRAGEIGAPV